MKGFVLLTSILLACLKGFAQNDTVFYYAANLKPSDSVNAISYDVLTKIEAGKFEISGYLKKQDNWVPALKEIITVLNDSTIEIYRYFNDEMISQVIRISKYDKNGFYHFREYYEDGNLRIEGRTLNKFPLHKIGEIKEYYKNGTTKTVSIFENNQLKSNQLWNEDGTKYMDNVFVTVDNLPQFPGGDSAFLQLIARNVQYPEHARNNGIQGKVIVQFVVMEDGSLNGVKIAQSVDPSLDKAAEEVIKSIRIKWEPAILDGENVRVVYKAPINFLLE